MTLAQYFNILCWHRIIQERKLNSYLGIKYRREISKQATLSTAHNGCCTKPWQVFEEGIFLFYKGICALTIEVNNFVLIPTNVGLAQYLLF